MDVTRPEAGPLPVLAPLRFALPHKGALAPGAAELLGSAGYQCGTPRVRLHAHDVGNGVEFVYLRARDVPKLVAQGLAELGITGRDLAADSGHKVVELLPLGFGQSAVRYAAPPESGLTLGALHGRRVATAFPTLTSDDLARRGIRAQVVEMAGAVENAVHLGIADAIADVVDSGRTLAQHGLRVLGPPLILSEAILVASPTSADTAGVQRVAHRLRQTMTTRPVSSRRAPARRGEG